MRKAKIFQNGRSQAVRIPKEYQFTGQEVYIKRIGHATLLIPMDSDPWKDWQASFALFSDDFMSDRNQPPMQDREPL